jgi:hypothetical protein
MLQFDAAPVVTSIPNCVSGKEFLSPNRELLGGMRDRGREASPVLRFIAAFDIYQCHQLRQPYFRVAFMNSAYRSV